MKVHIITSRPTLVNDIDIVRSIIGLVENEGHSIALPWVEAAYSREISQTKPHDDWASIYKLNLGAIAKADVIIAEASYENFAVGYQVSQAIQQKKPVLLLRQRVADKNSFVMGVEEGWAVREEYDKDSMGEIIRSFLRENDIQTKDMRFNFFIDRPIYNYLRWTSLKTGKTKAEILRELVEREIDREKM